MRSAMIRVAAASAITYASVSHAQHRDDALDLARCMWSEAGRSSPRDWVAILHVLDRRATLPALHDMSTADVARRYCVALSGRSRTERARRIRNASRDGVPAAALDLASRWIGGEHPHDPCGGMAWDWDDRRHAGREIIACGETQNVFFGKAKR